jgi:hypothetical protein
MIIDTEQSIMKKSYPTATVFILNFIWALDGLFADSKTRSLGLTAWGAEQVAWLWMYKDRSRDRLLRRRQRQSPTISELRNYHHLTKNSTA